MTSGESDVSELGGLPGAPPPPLGPPLEVPTMAPGDVVLLEMNGEKWAFVNLKRGQCVPARSPRRHVFSGNRESGARRVAAAAAKREALPLVARVSFDDDATFHAPLSHSTDARLFSTCFVALHAS